MPTAAYRDALIAFVRKEARPPDKFSHQPRLYQLAHELGAAEPHDDDILFAAAWLHDLGVFIGHRPADPEALARWDHVAYTTRKTPAILQQLGFPITKIPGVILAIEDHLPSRTPRTSEGRILRDTDILEQLGAIGILRTVSKVGRDTRFATFADALRVLQHNARTLPGQLQLPRARELAARRLDTLAQFLAAAETEAANLPF